jgi:hypothetical protein
MKVIEHVERLLRQGRKPKELVEMGFSKRVITRVRRQIKKDKADSQEKVAKETSKIKSRSRTKLQQKEKTPATMYKTSRGEPYIQEGHSQIVILNKMVTMLAIAEKFGADRQQSCSYFQEGICILQTWTSETEIPRGIGELIPPKSEKDGWQIKPSNLCCLMCTFPFEGRFEEIEAGLMGNPMSGAKYQFVCNGCGSQWCIVFNNILLLFYNLVDIIFPQHYIKQIEKTNKGIKQDTTL